MLTFTRLCGNQRRPQHRVTAHAGGHRTAPLAEARETKGEDSLENKGMGFYVQQNNCLKECKQREAQVLMATVPPPEGSAAALLQAVAQPFKAANRSFGVVMQFSAATGIQALLGFIHQIGQAVDGIQQIQASILPIRLQAFADGTATPLRKFLLKLLMQH